MHEIEHLLGKSWLWCDSLQRFVRWIARKCLAFKEWPLGRPFLECARLVLLLQHNEECCIRGYLLPRGACSGSAYSENNTSCIYTDQKVWGGCRTNRRARLAGTGTWWECVHSYSLRVLRRWISERNFTDGRWRRLRREHPDYNQKCQKLSGRALSRWFLRQR